MPKVLIIFINLFSGYFAILLKLRFNCDGHIFTDFICISAIHIISFSVSFLSWVDELNKLAGLHCMGLHSSAGRALQRERRGHRFVETPKNVFSGYFAIA